MMIEGIMELSYSQSSSYFQFLVPFPFDMNIFGSFAFMNFLNDPAVR